MYCVYWNIIAMVHYTEDVRSWEGPLLEVPQQTKGAYLKSKRHLKSLEETHIKYVLVPPDKAAQNVIVVLQVSGI